MAERYGLYEVIKTVEVAGIGRFEKGDRLTLSPSEAENLANKIKLVKEYRYSQADVEQSEPQEFNWRKIVGINPVH